MLDYFDKEVEEGDVILQAHQYGMFFFEVKRPPGETKLLHVLELDGCESAAIHKRSDHIVDLTKLLADFPYRDEVIEHVRREWKAAISRG